MPIGPSTKLVKQGDTYKTEADVPAPGNRGPTNRVTAARLTR